MAQENNDATKEAEAKAAAEKAKAAADKKAETKKSAPKKAAKEVDITELREKARTDYGIVNADDLEADQLNSEIKAIDDQAKQAEKEAAKAE